MKKKYVKKIPKVVELDNALTSYLDSTMDFGTKITMSRLAKELEITSTKTGHPHMNTVRNKIDEASKYADILKNFKLHRRDGILYEMEKIELKEVNMERVLDALLKIKEDINSIKKEIEILKAIKNQPS